MSSTHSRDSSPAYGEAALRVLANDINKSAHVMIITAVCRDVRQETSNDQSLAVVVASSEPLNANRAVDITDPLIMGNIREQLRSRGIKLGGALSEHMPGLQVYGETFFVPYRSLPRTTQVGDICSSLSASRNTTSRPARNCIIFSFPPLFATFNGSSAGIWRSLIIRCHRTAQLEAKKTHAPGRASGTLSAS